MKNDMGTNNDDKNILHEIQNLIAQNRDSKHLNKLIENIIIKNNIFVIVLDAELSVKYHNIPLKKPALVLNDFQYLMGNKLITEISDFIRNFKFDAEKLSHESVYFKSEELEYELYIADENFYLQLTRQEQKEKIIKRDTEELLDQAASRLDEVYELTKALERIRTISHQGHEQNDVICEEIKNVHLPALKNLKKEVNDPVLRVSLDIIETNLKEIFNPEEGLVKSIYKMLTPSEIQIAEFIRKGKSTRDIADALDIATKTVENHRNNLRNKLGITNKGVNLRSYLMQLKTEPK